MKAVPAENGAGWFVVRLNAVTPADPAELAPLIAQSKGELTQSMGEEYVQQLARAAGDGFGVARDPAAVAALKQQLLSGAAPAAR